MKKLAVITTHPIQYNAPLFRLLTERKKIDIKVFYTWGEASMVNKYDPGFAQVVNWDIPLLDGYSYEWLKNTSEKPGSDHFTGIRNPGIKERIAAFNPDAILLFGWSFHSHLKALRHFSGRVNILFRGDSTMLDPTGFIKNKLRFLFLTWVYTHVDKALYTGLRNREYYINYGLKESQLIFAPHAIDNARFNFTPENAAKANERRLRLGIGENEILIVFAGKFEKKKAPDLLISAFLKLQKKEAHLLLAGNGEIKGELMDLSGNSPNIHFMEFQNQSQMPVLYQMADVFVLPSNGPGETWGLTINEAMASGVAVIVSDRCGCAVDLVSNGVNGYIFKSGDINDLADKLMMMMSKSRTKEFGKASLRKIQPYSFEQICKAIEDSI